MRRRYLGGPGLRRSSHPATGTPSLCILAHPHPGSARTSFVHFKCLLFYVYIFTKSFLFTRTWQFGFTQVGFWGCSSLARTAVHDSGWTQATLPTFCRWTMRRFSLFHKCSKAALNCFLSPQTQAWEYLWGRCEVPGL